MIDSGLAWAIFGVSFIFIFMLIGILADNLRQKAKVAKQELLQKERMMAMERGLPLPEWDAVMLDDHGSPLSSAEAQERKKEWFRLVSLCPGLFLAFAGVGMIFAFSIGEANDFADIATVGFIPFMAGCGLLLFYVLTKPARTSK